MWKDKCFKELQLNLKGKVEQFFDRVQTDIDSSTDISGVQDKVEFVVDGNA